MKQRLKQYGVVITMLVGSQVLLIVTGYLAFKQIMIQERKGDSLSVSTLSGSVICFQQHCFDIEIADTESKREYGLMNRTSLSGQSGMLFVFDHADTYAFWMKNTKIPLDMIWLDHDGRVVDVQTAVPCTSDPCPVYTPAHSGLYVLELNAGSAHAIGLITGSMMTIYKK